MLGPKKLALSQKIEENNWAPTQLPLRGWYPLGGLTPTCTTLTQYRGRPNTLPGNSETNTRCAWGLRVWPRSFALCSGIFPASYSSASSRWASGWRRHLASDSPPLVQRSMFVMFVPEHGGGGGRKSLKQQIVCLQPGR